ncbi:hypothetical protein FEM03_11685 [Phragmitibacter flavus]|uniref:Uncharacterized protein n=1 Tax=Phragmitibacter flavus TaxID=2576071 RepID=A0A5R8KFL8_9BACT|nr:hypothetical protein [Phragmitibacter flavus]TLD70389.1 hypothetical protein FEM03_11685 [Phragmitibacter flavus]
MIPITKEKINSGLPAIGCAILVFVFMTPFIGLILKMRAQAREAENACAEFQRIVDANELRSWVFTQLKKNPQGVESTTTRNEWPSNFPRFDADCPYVYLYPMGQSPDEPMSASLAWSFGLYSLIVSVFLNPDGTAADVDRQSSWAKGITFYIIGK